MRIILTILLLFLSANFLMCQKLAHNYHKAITFAEAKNYIGKNVIVTGKIDQVVISKEGDYYLIFGGKFPNYRFSAVILKSEVSKFGKINTYEGKEVAVLGKITEENYKPQIILASNTRIKIIEEKSK